MGTVYLSAETVYDGNLLEQFGIYNRVTQDECTTYTSAASFFSTGDNKLSQIRLKNEFVLFRQSTHRRKSYSASHHEGTLTFRLGKPGQVGFYKFLGSCRENGQHWVVVVRPPMTTKHDTDGTHASQSEC